MSIEQRLLDLGLQLPATPKVTVATTFNWVRVLGDRVLVSGHGAQNPDGSPARPFGRVPDDVSPDQAAQSARLAALSVLSSVQQAIGDLDRIAAWVTVTGFVQAQPGFTGTTAVINGFSQVVLDVFGADVGQHARTAIGVAALPPGVVSWGCSRTCRDGVPCGHPRRGPDSRSRPCHPRRG